MSSRLAPELDDQVAEAVDDGSVLPETRLAMYVADGPDPLRHPIEVAELAFERGEDREGRQARRLVRLVEV
jgi:hypothetical protein